MNKRVSFIWHWCLVLTLLASSACERAPEPSTKNTTPSTLIPAPTQPDNTARNKGDTTGDKTPVDQSNSSADIKITAEIRRAVMDDKSISVNAQNCKIITDKSGVVTLRGPVDTQAEKDAIATKAQAVAGVARVINELEVKMH